MMLAPLLRGTGLLVALALVSSAQAQSLGGALWSDVSEASLTSSRSTSPTAYRTLRLDRAAMADLLARAPIEAPGLPGAIDVPIPSPDGSTVWFRVSESPVLMPGIQARYPQIRTYVGQGRDIASATVRLSLTPAGFAAMARTPEGTLFVDAYAQGDDAHYLAYFRRDLAPTDEQRVAFENEIVEDAASGDAGAAGPIDAPAGAMRIDNGTVLRTYRLAVSATGEYSRAVCGGAAATTACVLAAQATAVNRVNEVYGVDLAVRMVIIDTNDQLIFLDPAADPFTNNSGGTLINENQTFVTNTVGVENFDIGHVFSTGGGGVAGLGVVCSAGAKARGVTGLPNPVGDGFYIDYVAHEMGHQFRGNHTFNGNSGSCGGGNRNAATAVEPGSGTTIMAYAGICGSHNTQSASDAYFHATSLQEIVGFITSGGGSTCGAVTETGNDIPVLTTPPGFVLPISTPFALTGSATDATPDALTYAWEEIDPGSGSGGAPANNGVPTGPPFFRSFTPTTSPTRYFPQLTRRLSNLVPLRGEALPNDSRILTFRLTVRDNQAGGGAIADKNVFLATDAAAGPFVVTAFNTPGQSVFGDTPQTITWDVANTDLLDDAGAPDADNVDVENVEILYSRDNGVTFETLIASTPNDGAEDVIIPNVATVTPMGRIMVRAVGNVFFDVNDIAFDVVFNTSNEQAAAAVTGLSAVTPNPTTGRASFALRGASAGTVSVAVYDALGREVMRLHDGPAGDDQAFSIDVSRLPAGVYVVRASGASIQSMQRFTVVR